MANVPHLRSFKAWTLQLVRGMCMGVFDIIPGISGGTVAFIMGFYEDLLHSIKSIRWPLKNVSWDFLLATLIGIAISMVTLAHVITKILNHEVYRIYLYSIFMGLILASIVFCAKQVREWHKHYVSIMVFGAVVAFIFCTLLTQSKAHTHVYIENSLFQPWTMTCGTIAITAFFLPGISGSYILNILGMYPIVLAALAEFVVGLKNFSFDLNAFLILANMGVGIVVGALVFSRVISWFLDHYHQATLSLLTGFLIGALKTVWPFWSYEYIVNPFKVEAGPKLHAIEPILPTGDYQVIAISALLVFVGFGVVFTLESLAARMKES